MMIVTTDSIPGKKILDVKGIVFAEGKDLTSFNRACENRKSAMTSLSVNAENLGANAIIGFRLENSASGSNAASLLCQCYGTAVVIE